MKRGLWLLLLPIGLIGRPEWTGVMVLPDGPRFAVKFSATAPVAWLPLGAVCGSYRLTAFDPGPEVLTLRSGPAEISLHLPGAKVGPAPTLAAALQAAVRDEVAARDGWGGEARCGEPAPHGEELWVLVTREVAGRQEARMVILTRDGHVKDYWRV